MRAKLAFFTLHGFNIGCIVAFYIYNLNRDYPWVGQDFGFFMPRLIDTYLHLKLNGLAIQWYTPNFGGGLPAFANPHHLEYSLAQLLMFWLDPWQAFLTALGVFTAIGYVGAYIFQREILKFEMKAATLGAIFFSFSGFYLGHMLIGHVSFLQFPLLPIVPYLLLTRRLPPWGAGMMLSLLVASVIYSGGFYILVIFAFSSALVMPLAYLLRPQAFDFPHLTKTLLTGVLLTLPLMGSKLYAVQSFMRFFPREVYDSYAAGTLQKLTGIFFQLIGTTLIVPQRLLFGRDPNAIQAYLQARTGMDIQLWELDAAISGLAVIVLGIGVGWQLVRFARSRTRPGRSQVIAAVLLLLAASALAQYIITEGPFYVFSKMLPFIRSMHVNTRNTSAFILPIALLASFYLNHLFKRARNTTLFLFLNGLALASLTPYLAISPQSHLRFIEIKPLREVYWQIRAGETFPIQKIGDDLDIEAIDRNSSSLLLYEALFGYELQDFKPQVRVGSIYAQDANYLNMTNPASLIYPEENGLALFERFKVNERDKLEQFANRRQPQFNMPITQHVLNGLAIITLMAQMLVLLRFGWIRARQQGKPPSA